MYIERLLSAILRKAVKQFPSVLVTGPRQAGKTTFLMHDFGKKSDYVTFDDPLERSFALKDPNGFLDRFHKRPVILDEIQYVPDLLPYLKIRIDRDREKTGKWLLTGSQHFHLMKNISESLAGRVAVLDLLPFSILELEKKRAGAVESALWSGGYPEPFLYPDRRSLWLSSYIQTYIERDVRQLQNIKDLRTFELFIALLASLHGQSFNAATLSREVGVSLPTIKSWAGIMEASYLCFFLPPYFKNYGKRLVKTPKIYFLDSSLVCFLTRQPDAKSALSGAMGGAIFEGFMVSEAVKIFALKGKRPDIFFWRSHDGLEVDMILRIKNKLYPVEIKNTSTPTTRHLEAIDRFIKMAGRDSADHGLLICRVDKEMPMPGNHMAMPWHAFPQWLLRKIT
ncbi:MAG: ATP-binding protein [bacterium]